MSSLYLSISLALSLSPYAPGDIRVEATGDAFAAEFVLFTGYELTRKKNYVEVVSCVLFFLPRQEFFFPSRQAQQVRARFFLPAKTFLGLGACDCDAWTRAHAQPQEIN